MKKEFERALLICPARYSLYDSLRDVLAGMAQEVSAADIRSGISGLEKMVNTQMYRLPYRVRKRWELSFQLKVNQRIMQLADSYRPDLILVYNSQYLLPETCLTLKKRSKLLFFMGDSPFYTPQNNFYLSCLASADLVLSPDSFWAGQLNTLGIAQTMHFMPGMNERIYFRIDGNGAGNDEEETDILYVGASYVNSWGYRKAMLMSRFTRFRLRIYGNDSWERWFPFFPELAGCFRKSGFIPDERINRMFNKARIIPVDGNPGILNGVHIRMMEALAAGSLPLIEYRKDVEDLIFRDSGITLPLIRDYSTAGDLASRYLSDDRARRETADAMRKFIKEKYSPVNNAERIIARLKER